MQVHKRVGIWMDHSEAHIMPVTAGEMVTEILPSGFTQELRADTLDNGESTMHNAEKHLHSAYYKKLAGVIHGYTDVLLFGPTTAKEELHNLLKADHLFAQIDIVVKHSDKMTENQQHAFVRDYFHNKL